MVILSMETNIPVLLCLCLHLVVYRVYGKVATLVAAPPRCEQVFRPSLRVYAGCSYSSRSRISCCDSCISGCCCSCSPCTAHTILYSQHPNQCTCNCHHVTYSLCQSSRRRRTRSCTTHSSYYNNSRRTGVLLIPSLSNNSHCLVMYVIDLVLSVL